MKHTAEESQNKDGDAQPLSTHPPLNPFSFQINEKGGWIIDRDINEPTHIPAFSETRGHRVFSAKCVFLQNCVFYDGATFADECIFLPNNRFYGKIDIGPGSIIEENSVFADDVVFRRGCQIHNGCRLGASAYIDDDCVLPSIMVFPRTIKMGKIMFSGKKNVEQIWTVHDVTGNKGPLIVFCYCDQLGFRHYRVIYHDFNGYYRDFAEKARKNKDDQMLRAVERIVEDMVFSVNSKASNS